jgi:hypothetical protein
VALWKRYRRFYDAYVLEPALAWARPYAGMMTDLMRRRGRHVDSCARRLVDSEGVAMSCADPGSCVASVRPVFRRGRRSPTRQAGRARAR